MGRPPSPKRIAALAQVEAMKAQGLSLENMRAKLIESGLNVAQVNDLLPKPEPVKLKNDMPIAEKQPHTQLMQECAHFLDFAFSRMADCKPKHAGLRNDMAVWARKLKSATLGAA